MLCGSLTVAPHVRNYRIPGDEKILDPMYIATKDWKHTPVEDVSHSSF